MARKILKYGQGESVAVHLQNTPTYYINYKMEENRLNALIGLMHEGRVTRVIATEKRNVHLSKIVMIEHCFKEKGKHEITKKRKILRWLLCTFKDRKRNYMKGRIYLKQ